MKPAKSFFVDMERTIKAADNFSVFKRLFLQPFFNFFCYIPQKKKPCKTRLLKVLSFQHKLA